MKYGKFKNFYWSIFWGAIIFLPVLTQAAAFSLKPVKQEVIVSPGATIQKSITVTNNLGYSSYFKIGFKDIQFDQPLDQPKPYLLSELASLKEEEIWIADGQTKTIYFDINIPTEARPGGAYGYLQVVARPSAKAQAETSVAAALGSTIFIRIEGPIKENAELISFGVVGSRLKLRLPLTWHFSFANTGHIYLNPYGKILLTNKLTRQETLVDVPPGSVLPGQTRLFEVSSSSFGFPGWYSAVLFLNRGYNNEVDMRETDFWFLPWPILVLSLVAGLLFILVVILKIVRPRYQRNV